MKKEAAAAGDREESAEPDFGGEEAKEDGEDEEDIMNKSILFDF